MNLKLKRTKQKYAMRLIVFFSDVGPKLADKISTKNKKGYEIYLKKRVLTQFLFNLVDENAVSKFLASLKTKNSTGHDGISV